MSRSNTLRVAEVCSVFRLVGECCELGDDPILWRRHLTAQLGPLAGGGFCVVGEIGDGTLPSRHNLGAVDQGADNGFDRAGWLRGMEEFRVDSFINPHMNAVFARVPPGVVLPRADLVPDRDWYQSYCYQYLFRTLRADAGIFCVQTIPGARDDYNVLYLLRPVKEQDFNGRQRAIAAHAMAMLAPLLGGALSRFHEPAPSDLSARLRQVLRCLLEGDTDKQISARLGLTRHTVNQYTKAVFAHFGVRSRAELLARWIRRGWGARFAWADPVLRAPLPKAALG